MNDAVANSTEFLDKPDNVCAQSPVTGVHAKIGVHRRSADPADPN
jgi:hypothetical protein